jgi:hypothetical protein
VVDIEQTRHQIFIEGDGDGNVHQLATLGFKPRDLNFSGIFLQLRWRRR